MVLRVRPFNAREAGTKTCLLFPSPSSIQFTGDGAAGKPNFTFDKVYQPQAAQAEASDRKEQLIECAPSECMQPAAPCGVGCMWTVEYPD